MEKIWYSYWGKDYSGNMPAYYPNSVLPELENLKENYIPIREEVLQLLATQKTKPYSTYLAKKDKWQVLWFYFWGMKNRNALSEITVLKKCLNGISNLTNASISILEPNTVIDFHQGDCNGIYRCHFGIKIPAELPDCGIEVNKIKKQWKEGEYFIFCDAQEHSAWNNTNEARIILILDIIHPNFISIKKEIITNVLSGIWYQNVVSALPFIKSFPSKVRGIVRKILVLIINIYVPIQRFLNS